MLTWVKLPFFFFAPEGTESFLNFLPVCILLWLKCCLWQAVTTNSFFCLFSEVTFFLTSAFLEIIHLCLFCHCFLITVFLTSYCRELELCGDKLVLIPFFPVFFFFPSLEKGLSLLGYHLCNYSLTKNVFKTVAYQKSYEKSTSCGGWIPWMVCPRTYYKTQYHTVEVPETITVTDCCEGYEQVGLYCSLGKF